MIFTIKNLILDLEEATKACRTSRLAMVAANEANDRQASHQARQDCEYNIGRLDYLEEVAACFGVEVAS